jgi:predicted RNase H-like nuclease (RuvC/YqgF family)
MGEKQLLIIGIDPGTTVGYSAIDLKGNRIKVHSKKNLDSNSLISELIKLGKPLIITSDKKYNPDFVERIAVKLGSRIISPNYDLKVSEKRQITKEFNTKNQHEIDSLASALFTLNKISPLLKKINIFVEHYKKENIKQQLIEFVVGKELNIKDAAEIIEEPTKEETKIIKEVIEEKKLTEKDFLSLYNKFKAAKKDIFLLKEQNKKLKNQITAVKKDYEYMFKQMNKSQLDKKMQSLLEFKEKRIKFFDNELNRKNQEIKSMQDEITTLIYFLSNLNSSILLKKLDNLGLKEFEKKKNILNIKENDILLVQDPDITSEKTIDEIKNKVNIIFYKKPVSKKIASKLPFIFINANNINLEEDHYFGILNKEEFNKIKNKKELLDKIVDDYKKERSAQSE